MVSRDDNVFTGFAFGTAKGVADSVVRTGGGHVKGTVFVPMPEDYEPVKDPEYVWKDWEEHLLKKGWLPALFHSL